MNHHVFNLKVLQIKNKIQKQKVSNTIVNTFCFGHTSVVKVHVKVPAAAFVYPSRRSVETKRGILSTVGLWGPVGDVGGCGIIFRQFALNPKS